MYFRCSSASKPAWKGNSRVLFQNNSNHSPETRRRMTRSKLTDVSCLELTRQRMIPAPATASSRIQSGQSFCAASNVRSPPVTALPRPGVFAAVARAAWRHEEPAKATSQFWSVATLSWSPRKASQRAGGPFRLNTRTSTTFVPARSCSPTSTLAIFFQLRFCGS